MSNKDLYKQIAEDALRTIYWSRKAAAYFTYDRYKYAPMIVDELWKSIASEDEIIGWEEMEQRLGRRIKVEELIDAPISVPYFLFGSPIIEETIEAEEALHGFSFVIDEAIARGEIRATNHEIKSLIKWLERMTRK